MDETLTIADVAKELKMSYATVYNHRHRWGFFQMDGSRVWRIYKSELEKCRKRKNNVIRLVRSTGRKQEIKRCRSTKEAIHGGLILPRQVESELDRLLGHQ